MRPRTAATPGGPLHGCLQRSRRARRRRRPPPMRAARSLALRRGLEFRRYGHAQAVDAAPVGALHAKLELAERDTLAPARHAPELLHDQAGHGVELTFRQRDVEKLVELVDPGTAAYAELAVGFATDILIVLYIEFIVDVADDLFDDVLDGDQTRHAAVFIHYDRHVVAIAAELLE